MDKYAIIQNGVVINYIEYESQPENPPPSFPEGTIAVLNNNVGVGYTYSDGVFTAPASEKSEVEDTATKGAA